MGWRCPNCEAIVADHIRICPNGNYSPYVRRFGKLHMSTVSINFY
jgi:hypothetical protein